MFCSISSEDFEVTPALRDHIQANVDAIEVAVRPDSKVSVHLHREGKDRFSVTFRMRARRRDFVSRESGGDLYGCIEAARRHMIRQLEDIKDRKLAMRHHNKVSA